MPVSVVSAECWGGPQDGEEVRYGFLGTLIVVGSPEGEYRPFTVYRAGTLRRIWKWIQTEW